MRTHIKFLPDIKAFESLYLKASQKSKNYQIYL